MNEQTELHGGGRIIEGDPRLGKSKVFDKLVYMAKELMRRDFAVDDARAQEYYDHDRRDVPGEEVEYVIPLGKTDSVIYKGVASGGVIDREPDQYGDFLSLNEGENQIRTPEELFKPGSVTLDLGSGRAIALMKYSQQFPDAIFIGADYLYQEKRKVRPEKKGLQLTQGSWEKLDGIQDESVDNIISVQGVLMWGLGEIGGSKTEYAEGRGYVQVKFDPEKWKQMIDEYHRVLKVGGEIRLDAGLMEENEFLLLLGEMDHKQWDIMPLEVSKGKLFAKKIA